MQQLLQQALALWPGEWASAELAAQRENQVYRVVAEDGAIFALRFHRLGYRSDAELRAELDWMAALQLCGLSVPQPIASRAGHYIECTADYRVDMLTWLAGAPMGQTNAALHLADRAGTFYRVGRELARLHSFSDQWLPPADFARPQWDVEGLVGDFPLWGKFWENPALSRDERKLLLEARAAAYQQLLQTRDQLDYGLIHADLVRENVLIDGERLHFIDFDDSGFGFRLFDVATALLKNRSEPDYAALEAALFDGYHSVRALEAQHLALFLMLRAFTYLGWIIPRLGEPDAVARNQHNVAPALALAHAYLWRHGSR
jgi:Ser/Thr protein kinase RdoA (MazF antagonist)